MYYAQSDGDLVKSQIKKINGQSYGFDAFGKMLHGLYIIHYDTDGKTILTADKIEDEVKFPMKMMIIPMSTTSATLQRRAL